MNDDLDTRILPADLVTPVGAYLRLRDALGAPAFLLESVERGEQVGRYSFLGAGLPAVDSLEDAAAFAAARPGPGPGQPPFVGGAVGFLSYDWVTQLEPVPLPARDPADAGLPMMRFLLASTSVAFDHVRRTMTVTGPRAEVERVTAALDHPAVAPPAEPVAAGDGGRRDDARRLRRRRRAGEAPHRRRRRVPDRPVAARPPPTPRPRRSRSTGHCARSIRRRTCSCSTWASSS